MAFAFEKLVVYQTAVDFADQAAAATEQFPRGYGYLTDQLKVHPSPSPPTSPKAMGASPSPTGAIPSASSAMRLLRCLFTRRRFWSPVSGSREAYP
jgi:hypothetical protein